MTDEPVFSDAVSPPSGRVVDIFSTLQGEGLFVGQRQIFVRLSGCPWRCRYCDTPHSLEKEAHPSLSLKLVLDKILELQTARDHGAVSVTGGEPLLQSEFLAALLPSIKDLGLKTYLETSATHPHRLMKFLVMSCTSLGCRWLHGTNQPASIDTGPATGPLRRGSARR